jgi:hypothetical protein
VETQTEQSTLCLEPCGCKYFCQCADLAEQIEAVKRQMSVLFKENSLLKVELTECEDLQYQQVDQPPTPAMTPVKPNKHRKITQYNPTTSKEEKNQQSTSHDKECKEVGTNLEKNKINHTERDFEKETVKELQKESNINLISDDSSCDERNIINLLDEEDDFLELIDLCQKIEEKETDEDIIRIHQLEPTNAPDRDSGASNEPLDDEMHRIAEDECGDVITEISEETREAKGKIVIEVEDNSQDEENGQTICDKLEWGMNKKSPVLNHGLQASAIVVVLSDSDCELNHTTSIPTKRENSFSSSDCNARKRQKQNEN